MGVGLTPGALTGIGAAFKDVVVSLYNQSGHDVAVGEVMTLDLRASFASSDAIEMGTPGTRFDPWSSAVDLTAFNDGLGSAIGFPSYPIVVAAERIATRSKGRFFITGSRVLCKQGVNANGNDIPHTGVALVPGFNSFGGVAINQLVYMDGNASLTAAAGTRWVGWPLETNGDLDAPIHCRFDGLHYGVLGMPG